MNYTLLLSPSCSGQTNKEDLLRNQKENINHINLIGSEHDRKYRNMKHKKIFKLSATQQIYTGNYSKVSLKM